MAMLAAATLVFAVAVQPDAGLRDHPVVGQSVVYLDGQWDLTNADRSVRTHGDVPGDVITDLQTYNNLPDPLYETNFLDNAMWVNQTWTYSKSGIKLTSASYLVFDGIKMSAEITLNGHVLGYARDQFLRLVYPVGAYINASGSNLVEVTFDHSECDGRFMACTGGWDWAPYSTVYLDGAATLSYGIWKSVYVVESGPVMITHVNPQIMFLGDYPVTPLQDGDHAGFSLAVRVHTYCPSAVTAKITLTSEWGGSVTVQANLPKDNTTHYVNTTVNASDIRLWWPNGMGDQHLYRINVTVDTGSAAVTASRHVGFRFFALVTGNDTDPTYVEASKNAEGTETLGMVVRVNGVVMFNRGANLIPMEEFEGRQSAYAYAKLVEHAAAAHMNTFRVWGGGIFYPDVLYDACDRLGIVLYHDMMYAQVGHSPK
eukprot:gene7975-12244_t